MQGYKHKELGWIPEDWEVGNIGTTCEICNHLRFPLSEEVRNKIKGEYPYYGPTKIQGFINEYRVEGKFALIGEDGDHFLKFRDIPMTLLVEGKFNVNNHAHLVKGNNGCLTEWFYYFYKHRSIFTYLTRQGAGRFKLTKEALVRMPLAFPGIIEQRKIVTILNVWDHSIATLTRLIAAKQQYKKALRQQLLTGRKRLKGYKEHWEKISIGCLTEKIVNGATYDAKATGGTVPVTRIETIANWAIDYAKVGYAFPFPNQEDYRLQPGDILLSHINSIAHIGKVAIYKGEKDLYHGMNLLLIRPNQEKVIAPYLFEVLSSDQSQKHFKTYAKKAINQASINASDIKELSIILPGRAEQKAISDTLVKADNEINCLEKLLACVKLQKKGLMQQLLTGKKRVKV